MNFFNNNMQNVARIRNAQSRSISAENFNGAKGGGAMATEGTGAGAARDLGKGWKVSPSVNIPAHSKFTMADIEGPGEITHIWCTLVGNISRPLVLRIYWDDNETPSVEAPLTDFFAFADDRSFRQINSYPIAVNPRRALNCWWSMPFRRHCYMELENIVDEDIVLYYQVDYVLTEQPEDMAYFHAQFRRVNPLPYKSVYTILDGVEGKGQYVGTYLYWGVNNNSWWGEGEIKFYIDGDGEYPTICGTGTEDYFLGSYDFEIDNKYIEFSTLYSGMSCSREDDCYKSQKRFSMYRWHIQDPIYFSEDLKVTIQALGWREGGRYLPLKDDISSVAFWYQAAPAKKFPSFPNREEIEIV